MHLLAWLLPSPFDLHLSKHFAHRNDSKALLLAFDHGSKTTTASDESFSASLDTLIDDIVETVAVLNRDGYLAAEKATIPPFVPILVYKAAAITTAKLQADVEPEANLRRLRVLRNALKVIARRWLAGGENLYQILLLQLIFFRTLFELTGRGHNSPDFEGSWRLGLALRLIRRVLSVNLCQHFWKVFPNCSTWSDKNCSLRC
jgi:hypothetical protein